MAEKSSYNKDAELNDWENNSRMSEDEYPDFIKRFYKHHTGKELNLKNPQTFNEKLQWAKLYDREPMRTKLADKYAVREWVAEHIGEEYLIPLFGVWGNADDIDFDALPDKFVLKCNHGCAMNIIVKDKLQLDVTETRKRLNEWLKVKFAYKDLELHYVDIPPLIIAEEYLEDAESDDLPDYKFFCFNGVPEYCRVHIDRYTDHRENMYDMEWKLCPFVCGSYPNSDKDIPKPDCFDEMAELAHKLATWIPFVRVDMYVVNGRIYFGEMTFTPNSGCASFNPPEYDEKWGEMYELPKGKIKTACKAKQDEPLYVKIVDTILNADIYRCVFIILATARLYRYHVGFYDNIILPYIDYIILPWGYSIIIRDLLIKRTLFQTKRILLLIAFITLYAITLWINKEYYVNSVRLFQYMILYMLVLSSVNVSTNVLYKCKMIFFFCLMAIIPVSIMSGVSVWLFLKGHFTIQYTVENIAYTVQPMRISGIFGTENIAGYAPFLAITMSAISAVLVNKIIKNKYLILLGIISFITLALLNYVMLLLSDTRAAYFAVLVFVFIFALFSVYRLLSKKKLFFIFSCFISISAAVILTGTVFYIGEPVRTGVGMLQVHLSDDKETEDSVSVTAAYSLSFANANIIFSNDTSVNEESTEESIHYIEGRNIGFFDDTGRLELWKIAYDVAVKYPAFGVSSAGLGKAVMEAYYEGIEQGKGYEYNPELLEAYASGDSGMHNSYIQIAATNGFPALFLLLIFIIIFAFQYAKKLVSGVNLHYYYAAGGLYALCGAITLYLIFSSALLILYHPVTITFWSCLSFAGSLLQSEESSV